MSQDSSNRCPDCKGSGKYRGAFVEEDCHRCGGAGSLLDKQKALDSVFDYNDIRSKGQPISSDNLGPEFLTIPDTPESREAFERLKKLVEQADSISSLKPAKKQGFSPQLVVGDILHVYDNGWHEAVVQCFSCNPNDPVDTTVIHAKTPCGYFEVKKQLVGYNVTQGRWEYIRAGTPLWH